MSFSGSLILLVLMSQALPPSAPEHNVRPPQGLVPDAATAITIAVAVWTPLYGKEQIAAQKPYRAALADGQWTVTGSLPNGRLGGVAMAVIAQADGRILRVSHGR
jgi:hypothetical protein